MRALILIVTAILILFGSGIYLMLEWDEEWVDVGPSAEVLANPFTALERYIERQGVKHERLMMSKLNDDELPFQTGDLVLLQSSYGNLTPETSAKLLSWVANGGQLIVAATPNAYEFDDVEDPLFQQFGLLPFYPESLYEDEDEAYDEDEYEYEYDEEYSENEYDEEESGLAEYDENEQDGITDVAAEQATEAVEFKQCESTNDSTTSAPTRSFYARCEQLDGAAVQFGGELAIMANFDSTVRFEYYDELEPDLLEYDSSDDLAAVGYHWQQGHVYFVPDLALWHNPFIGCAQHARLFSHWMNDAQTVWFVRAQPQSGLLDIVYQRYPFVAASLIILLVLLCWSLISRRVPRYAPDQPEFRRWHEHLNAIANYYWRKEQSDLLIEQIRQQIWQRWALLGYGEQPKEDTASELSRYTHLPKTLVLDAMYAPAPQKPLPFTQMVKNLQQIRKKL